MISVARDQLKSVVERIERLEEEKAAVADDIKAVYAEAKGNGFDTKTIRKVIRLRKKTAEERQEEETLLDVYLAALGMTPIERAIAAAEEEDGALTPEQRTARARRRTSETMDDAKDLADQMLADGLISREAHAEQIRLADAVAATRGAGVIGGGSKRKGKPRSPAADFARDLAGGEAEAPPRRKGRLKDKMADALSAMGTPAALTEEERAKGYTAAFIDKNGTRMAIGTDVRI